MNTGAHTLTATAVLTQGAHSPFQQERWHQRWLRQQQAPCTKASHLKKVPTLPACLHNPAPTLQKRQVLANGLSGRQL